MASLFTVRALMALATRIGANPAKAISRSNISFLGKGPTKNPLFQSRLAGLENASPQNLRDPKKLFGAIEDAVGWAKDGKLNSIQKEILGHNLSGIERILHPPVLPTLPTASVTAIRPGIEGLRRFPKETHKFMGRPLKSKDFSEIDRMVMEGKIPDARGRTWNLKAPETGVDASGLKLAKPPKESSKSFLEEMTARGHKVLKPGTPEYEAYTKKGLRTFPGGKLPEPGAFQGWTPSVVPKVNIPASKINHQMIADKYGIDVELIRGKDWIEVLEVIRKLGYAEGGLAHIMQTPRRGRVTHPGGYAGSKRQAFIDLARRGGSRQDFIDLAASFNQAPFEGITIHDMLMSGALPSELKHGGRASLAHGGRIGFAEGEDWKSKIGDFLSDLGWEGIGEELRKERQMMKIAFDIIPTFTYPEHVSETPEQLKRYKKQMGYADTGNFMKDLGLAFTLGASRKPGEQWKNYKKFLEMENFERANIAKGGLAGILNL